MTIIISEEEMEWIDKKPFAWKIKDGCPEKIKEALEKKLDYLYKTKEESKK